MKAAKTSEKQSTAEKITAAFLLVMAGIYPLWLTCDYQTILQSKYYAFAVICCLYIGSMLAPGLLLLSKKAVKLPSPCILWKTSTLSQKLVFLFWVFCLVSTLLSEFAGAAIIGQGRFEGLLTLSLYCSCFLLVSCFARPDKRLIYVFGASMTIVCIIAAIQLTGANPFSIYPGNLNYYDANVAYSGAYLSTIGNTDLLASLLCVAIPVFAVSILRFREKLRFVLALPLALCLYILVREDVSAGLVGVGLGAVLCVPILLQKPAARKIAALCVALVLILGLTAVYFVGERVGPTPVNELSSILHGQAQDSFGSGRIYIWRETAKLVPERLLFGGGPDTLIARIGASFERYVPETGATLTAFIDSAHNEYLNILVNEGLLALLAYLAALICSACGWIRRSPKSDCAAIAGSAVLCYCVQALFGISCCISAPALWLSWAMLERTARK